MPHVSKNKLSLSVEKDLLETFSVVLTKLSQKDDVNKFLLALLTPTERIMLAKRLAIIILIKEGFEDSEISQLLHVTRITVSKMQLFLEARGEGYEIALQILQDEKLAKEVKLMITKLTTYAIRAAGGHVKPQIF